MPINKGHSSFIEKYGPFIQNMFYFISCQCRMKNVKLIPFVHLTVEKSIKDEYIYSNLLFLNLK